MRGPAYVKTTLILYFNMELFIQFTVVPHITDAIQEWVERVAKIPVDGDNATPDVCIIEVRMLPSALKILVCRVSEFFDWTVLHKQKALATAYSQNCIAMLID